MKKILTTAGLAIIMFVSAAICAHAQMVDVVHLKSGVVLKGTILENKPELSVTMTTVEGETVTIGWKQIDTIGREPLVSTEDSLQAAKNTSSKGRMTVFAGMAIAANEFGWFQIGAAKNGFAVGIDYSIPAAQSLSWLTTFVYASNPLDENVIGGSAAGVKDVGTYKSICPMTGCEFHTALSQALTLRIAGQFALYIAVYPGYTVDAAPSYSETFSSASTSALGTALTCAIDHKSGFSFQMRYMSSGLIWQRQDHTWSDDPATIVTRELVSKFSLVLITVGWTF